MKTAFMSRRSILILSILLVALGVVSRFLPHTWNFTPVTAIALAASAYLGVTYSIAIVLAVMALADISLGFYEWQIMLAVYGCFVASALIGALLKKNRTVLTVAAGSVASSVVFFIVTNLAVWQFSGMYTHTFYGLVDCFVAALPFYRGTLFGDLLFTGFFFGIFEISYRLLARTRPQTAAL